MWPDPPLANSFAASFATIRTPASHGRPRQAISPLGCCAGQWKPHPDRLIRQLADQLAEAMREDYFTDAQGRNVRAEHAARVVRGGVQIMLWDDIRTAPPQHMQIAFQLRRRQIVGDCRQLKTDVDSYNDNTNPSDPIQMVFDFTADIVKGSASTQSASSPDKLSRY